METFLNELVSRLQTVNVERIILFGSYAKGDYTNESDIDIVVILDTEDIPDTYDEKLELKVQVRESIYELSRQMAIDLVVYTRGEFEIIKDNKTSFFNELMTTGRILYEKAS